MKKIFYCLGLAVFLYGCGMGVEKDPSQNDTSGVLDQSLLLNTDLNYEVDETSLNCDFSPCLVSHNATVKYVFEVENVGVIDAEQLNYMQICPDISAMSASSASTGIFDERTGEWELTDLKVGKKAKLEIQCQLSEEMSGKAISGLVQGINQGDNENIFSYQLEVMSGCSPARSTKTEEALRGLSQKTKSDVRRSVLDHPGDSFDRLSFYPADIEESKKITDGMCLQTQDATTSLTIAALIEGEEDEFPEAFTINLGDRRVMAIDDSGELKDIHLEYESSQAECFKIQILTENESATKTFFNCINGASIFDAKKGK